MGSSQFGQSGYSVSGIGDFNADGHDDFIIGAPFADEGYVVFGNPEGYSPWFYSGYIYDQHPEGGSYLRGFGAIFFLSELDGTDGFKVSGFQSQEFGRTVSNAGDMNGDGFDDFLIGSRAFRSNEVRVVFGTADGFDGNFDLNTLDGSNGFIIKDGLGGEQYAGWDASNAGI